MKTLFTLLCLFAGLGWANAQITVSGQVTDTDNLPLPGANIIEKGTSNGSITDLDGKYTLTVSNGATLVVSFVGYESTEIAVEGRRVIDVVLDNQKLEEIVVVGSRTAPRSSTDTPVPVDVLSAKEITSSGQNSFDKALQYRIPSFNTVQTPVNDATALLDPYEIRNMGPSRTLILVNGKRKNLSSLIYVQSAPGQGETGTDISAIPVDAIKRVEVLRDGASAQYGSDAIAGVVNVVLKDDARYGSATLRTGITAKGDGAMLGFSLNNGNPLGKNGFINYTIDFSRVGEARRSGKVSAEAEYYDFVHQDLDNISNYVKVDEENPDHYMDDGNLISQDSLIERDYGKDDDETKLVDERFERYKRLQPISYDTLKSNLEQENVEGRKEVDDFLARHPYAGNRNSSPETTAAKFLVNGGFELTKGIDLYFNAAYIYKQVNSFANYRTPYWRTLGDYPYLNKLFYNPDPDVKNGYDGYQPSFDGVLTDYNGTVGFTAERSGWNYDLSFTVGGNKQTYRVRNSHNGNEVYTPFNWEDLNADKEIQNNELTRTGLYRENSPISFDPGGSAFNHIVGNIDINKALSNRIGIAFGSEFRAEFFEVIAGQKASYDGGGSDSFAGNRPEDSGIFHRFNFGGYVDVAWDILDNLLLNGTARLEHYSDFGSAFVWKVSSRYKLFDDKMTVRASVSTGFRAPTLHQIYTQKLQYSFSPGEGISIVGVFNNVSPQTRRLGVPLLKPETSTNITAGVGGKFFNKQLSFTVDYYNIEVRDRVLYTSRIGKTGVEKSKETPLDKLLDDYGIASLSFFTNGLNTRTSGLDVVVGYQNLRVGQRGLMSFNLSGNYTLQNKREGVLKQPDIVENANDVAEANGEKRQSIMTPTEEALAFTSRPKTKWILGINYEIGKFNVSVYNTLFGKSTFHNLGLDANLNVEFIPKVVTDLAVSYSATKKLTVAINFNNILNILPEWELVAKNEEGQALLDQPNKKDNQINLLTFNRRYMQVTYDGSHFSQLGALFNLSVNYRF